MNDIVSSPNILIKSPRGALLGRGREFEDTWPYQLTSIGLLLWWIAYLYPVIAPIPINENVAADATAEGSIINRLLVISFAVGGGIYLPRAIRSLRAQQKARPLFVLLVAYLLWSALSIFWSADIALSIRRFGILLLLIVGSMGLGAGFYTQTRAQTLTLARHVLYASWIAIAVMIASRLGRLNISEILNPEWTLKDDTVAAYYMYAAAYGLISVLVLYPSARKRFLPLLFLGSALLLLKGRTMVAGTLAASLLISSLLAKRGCWRTTAFFLGFILMLVQVDLATGGLIVLSCADWVANNLASLLPFLTIGNGMKDLLLLSGRIPLWHTLWPYFLDHPFVGHGFGAFWSSNRFDDIYREVKWHAVVAHNGFLDELLGTGAIGLLLLLALLYASITFALHLASEDKRSGYLVLGWLLLFLVCNSMGTILQFYFQAPTLFLATALFTALAQPKVVRPWGTGHVLDTK